MPKDEWVVAVDAADGAEGRRRSSRVAGRSRPASRAYSPPDELEKYPDQRSRRANRTRNNAKGPKTRREERRAARRTWTNKYTPEETALLELYQALERVSREAAAAAAAAEITTEPEAPDPTETEEMRAERLEAAKAALQEQAKRRQREREAALARDALEIKAAEAAGTAGASGPTGEVRSTFADGPGVGTAELRVAEQDEDPYSIFVGDIRIDTTKGMLNRAFSPFGMIDHIRLFAGKPFCFVTFCDPADAAEAMRRMNGELVNGVRIRTAPAVRSARPQAAAPPPTQPAQPAGPPPMADQVALPPTLATTAPDFSAATSPQPGGAPLAGSGSQLPAPAAVAASAGGGGPAQGQVPGSAPGQASAVPGDPAAAAPPVSSALPPGQDGQRRIMRTYDAEDDWLDEI